jgi:hypothetical protein
MNDRDVDAGLERALELSRQLLAVAEHGDVRAVADLDAERLRLLHSQRLKSRHMDADERLILQMINELNDKAIGFLEHRRRGTEREMDTVAVGRRALIAYSDTRLQR